MIGDDPQLAAGDEDAVGVLQEGVLHDAFLVVPLLGPGVGEVEVDHAADAIGHAPAEQLRRVGVQHADVGELPTPDAVGCVLVKLPRPLDAEDVGLRIGRALLDQERALARADLDLEGLRRVGEPLSRIDLPGGNVREVVGHGRQLIGRDAHDARGVVKGSAVAESEGHGGSIGQRVG